jgi:hypothetical protein
MRAMTARIHEYARAAGRDPNAIGLESQLNVGREGPTSGAPSSPAGAIGQPVVNAVLSRLAHSAMEAS